MKFLALAAILLLSPEIAETQSLSNPRNINSPKPKLDKVPIIKIYSVCNIYIKILYTKKHAEL